MLYEQTNRTIAVTVPVHIHTAHAASYVAPTTCAVTLCGTRAALMHFMQSAPQINIFTDELSHGLHTITITPQHLLLPHNIQLLHYATIPLMKLL